MPTAIFGITNNGLNLAATLFVLMLVVVWLSLIVYTYLDARRRVSDPFLVGCATIASFIPFLGTAVYAILRPPEFLEDAHERELEIRAAELRVRQLTEQSCPNCEYPVEKNYLRCPNCQHRLKDPCPTCRKPVDPRWTLCPYCETELAPRRRSRQPEEARPEGERARPRRSAPPPESRRSAAPPESRRSAPQPEGEAPPAERPAPKRRKKAPASASTTPEPATRAAPKEATSAKQQKRSTSREPDSDPRQA